MSLHGRLAGGLAALETRHRLRRLLPAAGLDFASNDYLGLATSDLMREAACAALARGVPVGAGGSRLLRGNHSEHEALEAQAARFFGTEAALYMGGGFQANQALFSTLPAPGDLIVHDALIHASAHEGMRLGRAEMTSFAHNDVASARQAIAAWRTKGGRGQIWIAVETVYSMEGDRAPLADLDALALETEAVLIVDEAHATGVFGRQGRGLAHDLRAEVLSLHTCGKALGGSGALICGPKVMIDTLINRARPFIFATAPAPLNASLVQAALTALERNPDLQAGAQSRIQAAHKAAHRHLQIEGLASQIIPVIVGHDTPTMELARTVQAAGFDVRGIRPPTIPRGTARLRISITGHVMPEQIDTLFGTVAALQRGTA